MATAARRKLTAADFRRLPDDGNRHEVLDGEWIMTPPPGVDHQRAVRNLLRRLDAHVSERRLGEVFAAPVGVLLSRTDAVQPDLLFVSRDRALRVRKDAVHGAPDLVVEVVSPSTAAIDRGRKRELYRRSGVREYWIVDPDARTAEVHSFGNPRKTHVFQEGQTFASEVLPGFRLAVAEIFRSAR